VKFLKIYKGGGKKLKRCSESATNGNGKGHRVIKKRWQFSAGEMSRPKCSLRYGERGGAALGQGGYFRRGPGCL